MNDNDIEYDHRKIEAKWQKIWQEKGVFKTPVLSAGQPDKFYCLDMFPYPSGEGLHVGHPRGYTATDVYSRYLRLKGKAVLHPMGWDAFGLPAENYAIKNQIHPRQAVEQNIRRFKKQIQSFGYSYDWSREINTTDPEYYRWTQWIFLKMFKRGLAYEAKAPINWCPSCQTGLANEEVIAGRCERCKTKVEIKKIRQWMLKITAYADRLLADLKDLDWPEPIKIMQQNWIGRSKGAKIIFQIKDSKERLEVFTTRPDTLFGCTFMVVAPEHSIIKKLKTKIDNFTAVEKYIRQAKKQINYNHDKEKTGIELEGLQAINPANNQPIPIFAADYVETGYGTGAIMSVPAHDKRDWEFAQKFNLPIKEVVVDDKIVSSGKYSGMGGLAGGQAIVKDLQDQSLAKPTVQYKLRDWVFSRQRYWGEPIPIVHCDKCGAQPVSEKDLPVKLPEVEKYQPTGTGESPLAGVADWVNTTCPECGGPGRRETNTMPQWAGSCWYYLRYIDPNDSQALVDKQEEKQWLPVNLYVGGAEHAVLHLLYARFWHKVLYDEKVVSTKEPFQKLISVGTILAPDGQKMSKSRGNVISPDDLIAKYGADSLRLYELFLGPFSQPVAWDKQGIVGMRRFLEKVWALPQFVSNKTLPEVEDLLNQTIIEAAQDIESFSFNTAIAKMMSFVNVVYQNKAIAAEQFKKFLIILSPFAPHLCAELWPKSVHPRGAQIGQQSYPAGGKIKAQKKIIIPVQVNGRLRSQIIIDRELSQEQIIKEARQDAKIVIYLKNRTILKSIYVPLKIINFVVK